MKHLGTLYCYEMKKLLKKKFVWAAMLVCTVISIFSVLSGLIAEYSSGSTGADGRYVTDNDYEKALSGRKIDQQLLSEMKEGYSRIPLTAEHYTATEEYRKYARPYSAVFNFVRNTTHMTVSELMQWKVDEEDLYRRRQDMLEKEWQDAGLDTGEKNYWKQKEAELKTPVTYYYTEGYYFLYQAVSTIGILLLLFTAVCLPGVFAEEHTRRTDQLILSSSCGRGTTYWAKILAGSSFAAGAAAVVSVIVFLISFCVYGTEGFSAAFQLLLPECSASVTAGKAILIIYGILILTSAVTGIFVMVLSEILHSSIATLGISAGCQILTMMFQIPGQYRVLSQIWIYLPGSFLAPWNIFDQRLISVFGRYFTAWQAVPLIYITAGILTAVLGKWIYQRYQVSGR